jgi:hypothetical protein
MRIFSSWADSALHDDPPSGAPTGGAPAGGANPPAAGAPPAPAPAGQPAGAPLPAGNPPAAPAPGAPPAGQPPAGQPPAGQPYRPQGLPDHLYGKTDQETIDKLATAMAGYRNRDASVPEKPEAYKQFAQVDAAIKPHIDQLANDPLFDRLTAKAKERGMPLADFQGLTADLFTLATEMGVLEAPIDFAAERDKLTPEAAKHLPPNEQKAARERRMTDNFAFMDTLVAPDGQPGLQKETVEFVKSQIGDTAAGHQFIEHLRALASTAGAGPLLQPGGGTQGSAREELQRQMSAPEMQANHPKFSKAAYEALVAQYQKLIPE